MTRKEVMEVVGDLVPALVAVLVGAVVTVVVLGTMYLAG